MNENEESQTPPEQNAPQQETEPHPFDMSERRDFGVVLALLAIIAIIGAAAVVFMRKGGPTGPRPSETAMGPEIAARVGDREVTMQEFKVWLASLPDSVQMQIGSVEGRRAILGQFLNRIAVNEYAKAQGVYDTEAFKKEYEMMRDNFAVRELVDETFSAQASEDDLKKFYKDNRDRFPRPMDDPSQQSLMVEEYRRSIVAGFADIFLNDATVQKAKDFSEPVIAQIVYKNGDQDTITLEDWEVELSGLDTDQQRWSRTPEGREELLQRLLRRRALARIARLREYHTRPSIDAALSQVKPHIAARVLSLAELKDIDPIVDEEIANNRDAYQEARMELAHILVRLPADASGAEDYKARTKIEDIAAEIKKDPKRFAAIAAAESEDARSAPKGGELGVIANSELIDPMAEAAFKLKIGEISPPVRTLAGYHIIKAISDPHAEFDEGVARAMARRRIVEGAMEAMVAEIIAKVGVSVNNAAIDGWDPVSQFLEAQAAAAEGGAEPGSPPAPPAVPEAK